jgi:hypothetical protein
MLLPCHKRRIGGILLTTSDQLASGLEASPWGLPYRYRSGSLSRKAWAVLGRWVSSQKTRAVCNFIPGTRIGNCSRDVESQNRCPRSQKSAPHCFAPAMRSTSGSSGERREPWKLRVSRLCKGGQRVLTDPMPRPSSSQIRSRPRGEQGALS